MSLFLTQSCNLKCVYCYGEGGGYGTGGSMDEKTDFQAVDWLLEQSGKIKKLLAVMPETPVAFFKKILAKYHEILYNMRRTNLIRHKRKKLF